MKCTCKVGNNGGWYTFRQLRSPFPIFTVYHIVTFHLVQAEVLATRHQHRPMGEMCVFLKKHNNIFMPCDDDRLEYIVTAYIYYYRCSGMACDVSAISIIQDSPYVREKPLDDVPPSKILPITIFYTRHCSQLLTKYKS